MSQPSKLFEPYHAWPADAAQPLCDGAADAQSRRSSRHGAEPVGSAIITGSAPSAGLLISEASQVSQQGQGYQDTPGHLFEGAGRGLAQGDRPRA